MTSPFGAREPRSADQFVGQEIHQQGVDPPSVPQMLVLAHPADGSEADLGVGRDGMRVAGRRVDRQPVMATLVEEIGGQRADRVRA